MERKDEGHVARKDVTWTTSTSGLVAKRLLSGFRAAVRRCQYDYRKCSFEWIWLLCLHTSTSHHSHYLGKEPFWYQGNQKCWLLLQLQVSRTSTTAVHAILLFWGIWCDIHVQIRVSTFSPSNLESSFIVRACPHSLFFCSVRGSCRWFNCIVEWITFCKHPSKWHTELIALYLALGFESDGIEAFHLALVEPSAFTCAWKWPYHLTFAWPHAEATR